VFQGSAGNSYTGTACLQITLDAVPTQTELRQQFGQSAGTLATLKPDTQYALNVWVKVSAAPGAGSLILDLWHGSTVINDDQATPNAKTITLSALTGTYANFNAVFRTPAVLPAAAYLRIRLSGAVAGDTGKSIFIDRLALNQMTQLNGSGTGANGGIWLSIF